jgi:hypothetical protein
MIGEFCPKAFALKVHPECRLNTLTAETGAEVSAAIVIRAKKPVLLRARPGPRLLRCIVYFNHCFL